MQIGVREIARAEARVETGGKVGPTALEVMANIDAMELAIHGATAVERFSVKEIQAIHRRLMERAPISRVAGRISSTWSCAAVASHRRTSHRSALYWQLSGTDTSRDGPVTEMAISGSGWSISPLRRPALRNSLRPTSKLSES